MKTPTQIRAKARAHAETALKILAEIMADPSAPQGVRVAAASQILNRGFCALAPDHIKFVPDRREHYVYSIHNQRGRLVYIGKGVGRRSFNSARRLGGNPRIRAVFATPKQALAFEARLIRRFKPEHNIALKGA
jgi:hypothetical protein